MVFPPSPAARRSILRALRRSLLFGAATLASVNLAVLAVSLVARAGTEASAPDVSGVDNLRVVDARVLRGDAPSPDGYRGLAELGVTTVVDLRAEHHLDVPEELLASLGIHWVHLPVRDGQTPTTAQVRQFMEVVDEAPGLVYLHCGAGVGRTGAMTAAYLVGTGQGSARAALRLNLAVGPPSIEQIVYAASLDAGEYRQPSLVVKAVSRVFDAPRRLWSRFGP